ncbi:hypothetical protein TrispH2_007546 [Trichoplax sp. H2]|nr:hypothetical protein TrispH2_007546 [Trichoplax sp. H2]|eukprot:RDD39821.1 hypothetical protein TrispH2_007546 [Trichoplax sp. H2]
MSRYGSESTISQCPISSSGISTCKFFRSAGVICEKLRPSALKNLTSSKSNGNVNLTKNHRENAIMITIGCILAAIASITFTAAYYFRRFWKRNAYQREEPEAYRQQMDRRNLNKGYPPTY